jgi:DNA-binding phage protein
VFAEWRNTVKLCGGNKRSQDEDISKACGCWRDRQRGKEKMEQEEISATKDRAHDDAMAEVFRKDPAYAEELLNSILGNGDQGELLIALRQMTQAFGGVPKVAEQARLNRTQLYRTLPADGNPEIRSLSVILRRWVLRLAVQPVQTPAAHARRPAGREQIIQAA